MMKTRPKRNEILKRCLWCGTDPLTVNYHDLEWGVPVHDDRKLFEMLTLEGAQAGLNWHTILKKRQGYRRAFRNFNPAAIARFTERDISRLMNDPGIVRNRLKIGSVVSNARLLLKQFPERGSFSRFLWSFAGRRLQVNKRRTLNDIPASTPESDAMASALKKLGFRFVGSTICYAFMQAIGMVNDHLKTCYRYSELLNDA